MKLSDFILLSGEEKKFAVLHEGVLIAKRQAGKMMIFLFQLDAFYVEMFCSLEQKSVSEYRIFDATKLLQPYLDAIPIHELLE